MKNNPFFERVWAAPGDYSVAEVFCAKVYRKSVRENDPCLTIRDRFAHIPELSNVLRSQEYSEIGVHFETMDLYWVLEEFQALNWQLVKVARNDEYEPYFVLQDKDDYRPQSSNSEAATLLLEKKAEYGGNLPKAALWALLNAIEVAGFGIHIYEENGREAGLELEDWTPNGVDMIQFLDLRSVEGNRASVFAIRDELRSYVEDYDPDEEVRVHMEDKQFAADFSCLDAAKEFTDWGKCLEALADSVDQVVEEAEKLGLEEDAYEAEFFSIREIYEEV